MAGSAPEAPRRSVGRPAAKHGKVDLTGQYDNARKWLPHLAAARSLDGLCTAMAPFLGSLPQPSNVAAVIGGRKPLTDKFLRALHCAFALNLPGLPPEIWTGSPATFGLLLEALLVQDPRTALRRIAAASPWATLTPERFMGAGAPVTTSGLSVRVGDRVGATVRLPCPGHLTLINADPAADHAVYYWLDPWLCGPERSYQAESLTLPGNGPLVPIGHPANVVSTLIAIVTRMPLTLKWPRPVERHVCPEIPLPLVRQLVVEVLALPHPDRTTSFFDYTVLPAGVA